jgi:RNA polymerase sigma-70 factor (ECF subfamily)
MADQVSSDSSRFERVVLPHLDAAYTLARYLTRDAADAEDVLQETVLRALRYFHTLRNDLDARAWLLAIARRESYEFRGNRRARMETVAYDDAPPIRLVDPADSPETAAHRTLLQARVAKAIDELPDRLRETLILRELQQCSYEEIALITDVPLGTVMSRLSRARARLGESLRDAIDIGELA